MSVGEVAEELLQYLALLLRQVRVIIELMQVADVGKHFLGIGHILVDIIEVGQQ